MHSNFIKKLHFSRYSFFDKDVQTFQNVAIGARFSKLEIVKKYSMFHNLIIYLRDIMNLTYFYVNLIYNRKK